MTRDLLCRRHFVGAGLAGLASAAGMRVSRAGLQAAKLEQELRFELVETAGLRRFSYPVSAILPGVRQGNHFRLSRAGKAVPAQFRVIDGPDGGTSVALDFNASPGPLATESYVITYGDDLEPGPEPKPGLRVERSGEAFRVWNGTALEYLVPADLLGWLTRVTNARRSFLAERSEGLFILGTDGMTHRVGGKGLDGTAPRATVVREGPLAVSLRFECDTPLIGQRSARSVATLTFFSSKSWVQTTWTVDDPEGSVAGLGLDLALAIEGGPTLVDLGATGTVYGQLRGKERMILRAGAVPGVAPREPAEGLGWAVLKGPADRLEPFALATKDAGPAEGWAHVIDSTRCTALAVAGFGRSTRDRIEIDAGGRTRVWRDFAGQGMGPQPGPKSLTCWVHFVSTPVQVGAATSPQAMASPLRLDWQNSPS